MYFYYQILEIIEEYGSKVVQHNRMEYAVSDLLVLEREEQVP